jgi:hypothetical protein
MRLNDPDDDVHAFSLELMGILQHLICLSHTGSRADVNAQAGPLALFQFGE